MFFNKAIEIKLKEENAFKFNIECFLILSETIIRKIIDKV